MLVRFMLTAVLAAGFASAQGGRGGGGGDMGGEGGMSAAGGGMGGEGGMGGGAPRMQRPTKAQMFVEKLKLNSDQQEEVQKILSEASQKANPVAGRISQGRQAIATLLLQKKTDEEMKPVMEQFAAVCADLTRIEADAFARIYATLKPNQQKAAPQAFVLMAEMFIPASAGGGRGMGRGGMAGGQGRGGRK
jgi:hypothetical protein